MGGARGCDGPGGDTPGGQMRSTHETDTCDFGVSKTMVVTAELKAMSNATDADFGRQCAPTGEFTSTSLIRMTSPQRLQVL